MYLENIKGWKNIVYKDAYIGMEYSATRYIVLQYNIREEDNVRDAGRMRKRVAFKWDNC